MNTYTVTYWPPGGAAVTTAVTAAEFMLDDGFVMFLDTGQHAVFAVPTALNPVITQATA